MCRIFNNVNILMLCKIVYDRWKSVFRNSIITINKGNVSAFGNIKSHVSGTSWTSVLLVDYANTSIL